MPDLHDYPTSSADLKKKLRSFQMCASRLFSFTAYSLWYCIKRFQKVLIVERYLRTPPRKMRHPILASICNRFDSIPVKRPEMWPEFAMHIYEKNRPKTSEKPLRNPEPFKNLSNSKGFEIFTF